MRISLLGKKLGMSEIRSGRLTLPVTLINIVDHDIFGMKNVVKHGYNAVVLSAGEVKKEKHVKKPLLKQFQNLDLTPRNEVFEVRVESDTPLQSATQTEEDVLDYLKNMVVDISGVTLGKGFAGPMKRHNFAGLEATHGVSISHRSHGSTGQRQDPGRVFKGKKMAGHMGSKKRTVQNLRIVDVDKDLRVIAVHGAVPGHDNSYVFINDAVKIGRQSFFTKLNNINLVF